MTVRVPSPSGGRAVITHTFGTMTTDLLVIRDWLQAHGVTHVAMESTGRLLAAVVLPAGG